MATFIKIATVELGAGGASTIDFTSISATWTDLVIKISARTNRTLEVDGIKLSFNSDTNAANYSGKRLYGTGTSTGTDSVWYAMPFMSAANATSSCFSNTEIVIPNYAGSTQKRWSIDGVGENNGTTTYLGLGTGLWTGTAAITSVSIIPEVGTTILQYSSATLYGIKKS